MRVLMLKNKTTPVDTYHETFTALGHTPEFIPLLNHCPVSVEETTNFLCSRQFLEETDLFIITSQRAVEVFHLCLNEISKQSTHLASRIRSKTGYTVGPATEEILKANGFSDVRGGSDAGSGAVLADIILKEMDRSKKQKIVFFTGTIRKDIIPVKLRSQGVNIEEVVIYKTECKRGIVDHFLRCCEEPVDWIVFFSPQGTEEIVERLQRQEIESLRGTRVASIGPTTEEYLVSKGISASVVAAKPTAKALVESLQTVEARSLGP
ncbi:hypothetical_protein [Candidozyma auris]|uniref:uroporphyrinogen-III synthase HEM4 n=1 Tax=Candidozyma auris TaxID=498019 RepID=UPI000D2DC09D|nr:uroporphyrinogen-III synthase HEM4 [[Candida] auris]QEO21632.1 hypothetical_protein [[Candida] auris]GBL47867.1 hypothetical protein CAJCM15448_01410 [[Candida] auris]